jgi:hypothetical protein
MTSQASQVLTHTPTQDHARMLTRGWRAGRLPDVRAQEPLAKTCLEYDTETRGAVVAVGTCW